jgi:hypothetical protein
MSCRVQMAGRASSGLVDLVEPPHMILAIIEEGDHRRNADPLLSVQHARA